MKRYAWIWLGLFFLGFYLGHATGNRQEETFSLPPAFSYPTEATQHQAPPTDPPTQPAVPLDNTLPCALQYTTLVAQSLAMYDGPCLEDGSADELIGVAALILENTGTIGIHYAQIVIEQEGNELHFDATYIPPRGTVLIIESNRTPYSGAEVDSCHCRTVIPGSFDWSEDQIAISPTGNFSMEVTNLTDTTLRNIRIYYKQHRKEYDIYVGGITYSTVITTLAPGESCIISPYGYACGYAQVVAVEVDPYQT